jgi:hypothetical protein
MIECCHLTSGDRALDIIAHGWCRHTVRVGEKEGVPLTRCLGRVHLPSGFDGARGTVPAWLLEALGKAGVPDEDPTMWKPMPLTGIWNPNGGAAITVIFNSDVSLDEFRCEERVCVLNRKTREIWYTDHLEWTGEWLVPVEVAERGGRLLPGRVRRKKRRRRR